MGKFIYLMLKNEVLYLKYCKYFVEGGSYTLKGILD